MSYWNSADDLEFAKVNQGLAQVQTDLRNRQLDPEDGLPMLQELEGHRAEYEQRKEQARVAAMGRQRVQAQDEAAFQQSTLARNQEHSAENFMKTTAVFHDPEGKGPARYFYQESPGNFKPMEQGVTPDTPTHGPAILDEANMTPDPENMFAHTEDRTGPPEKEPVVQPRTPEPPPPGTFQQTIQNGPEQTIITRDGQGRVINLEGSPAGLHGVLGAAGTSLDQSDPAIVQQAWERANASVQGPPSAERFQQVQREFSKQLPKMEDAATGERYGLSRKQVASIRQEAQGLLAGLPPRVAQARYPATVIQLLRTAGAAQRQHSQELMQQEREKKKIEAEQRKQTADLTTKQKVDLYEQKLKEIQHDIDKKQKDLGPGETMADKYPNEPYLWDREHHEAEAHRRAEREYKRHYGGTTQTAPASEPAAPAATKPPEAEIPRPQQAPPEGVSLQALLAEKQRREEAARPPAKPPGASIRERGFVR